jgi:hypothetical protein
VKPPKLPMMNFRSVLTVAFVKKTLGLGSIPQCPHWLALTWSATKMGQFFIFRVFSLPQLPLYYICIVGHILELIF